MHDDAPAPAPPGLDLDALTQQLVSQAAELIYQADRRALPVHRAWVYQRAEQVRAMGKEAAPWYVGWIDPGKKRCHKSCGRGPDGRRAAWQLKRQVEAQLLTGTYGLKLNATWREFRAEYEQKHLTFLAASTRRKAADAMNNFERIVRPGLVSALTSRHVDEFAAARQREASQRRKGQLVAPASVNTDLGHLRVALRKARRWGYLEEVPDVQLLRVPRRLPRYVTPEHFAALYAACDLAGLPAGHAYPASDWWRAFLATAYLTGWRLGDLLNLRREDVDFGAGLAVIRWDAEGNKGRREERVALHPLVSEHLKRLPGFTPKLFRWPHGLTTLYAEFARLQRAAGVRLTCRESHEHAECCHRYGFHDLRRAFATMNADRLAAGALQTLMRHKSPQTTQVYINMARQVDDAVGKLFVPDVLVKKTS